MGLDKLIELNKRIKEEIDAAFIDEINAAISAYGSVINLKQLKEYGIKPVYISSPITTGLFMYNQFEKHKVKTIAELMQINPNAKKEIINRNSQEGIRFGEEVRNRGFPIVISPGIFFAKGWAQEHYMSLWKSVIIENSLIVAYNDNFHYSDGCAEEFLIGLQNDKELRARDNLKLIRPKEEIPKFEKAINQIEKKTGEIPKRLYDSYEEIVRLLK